ncbi:ferric/cupric reductase transmembrane component-like protein 8 [Elsinoe australis]|uniref:Ferric/cupric reductase transmembrane component-like protein 8 n=1 Tax=Elsinoe australis TaxID=40998 RepID=A0A4U7ASC2_9PEZI|nr:ferric/cupric reductase transmembrane component-like protein 8 [Elsinoe australis]
MSFRHVHHHFGAAVASPPHVHTAASLLMPRHPFPETEPLLGEPISLPNAHNYGLLGNLTSAAAVFTHGLTGVDQKANYLFAALLGFSLAGLIAATLIFRWLRMGSAHMRFLFTLGDKGNQRYWAQNQTNWWPAIKRHLLYAPLFRVRHNREIQLSSAVSIGTLPSRFHTLLLVVYLASNIAYCLVLDWSQPEAASVLAELRGRSGELATLNIIPTVLFALRNNPLIPILRVSYDTFNLFHRWCARMVLIQSLLHTVAFAVNAVSAGGMPAFNTALATSVSYKWGMVATCVFAGMVFLAMSPLRHAFYETFVNMHRALALVALIGVYIHIEKAKLPQLPYLRAVFALWGAEWVVRIYKIVYHNISLRGMTQVTVEALPAEACRVTFQLARPWRFVPGAHVHVYLPSISGWSSHPFSVAWAETTMKVPAMDLDVEKLPPYTFASPELNRDSAFKAPMPELTLVKTDVDLRSTPNKDATTSVSIVVRCRTGMTKKLYEKASASPKGQIVIRGGIEGPYGGHEPLTSYGTVLLFAGGVGITHCISYMKDLLTHYADGTCSTRRVLLVWSLPNTEALEWVRPWMDQILRMQGRKDILRIQLFITKPRHQNEIRSNTGTVQMFPGRCNPTTIIDKEMADRIGAMGVVVCGPGAFADSVRAATRAKVQTGSVDFIEEAFTY